MRPAIAAQTTLLAAILAMVAPRMADASTFIKLDLPSLTANADRVVVGRVTDIESLRHRGRIVTDVEIRVRDQWKGPPDAPDTLTVRKPGGRVGDVTTRVHGMPRFRRRGRVLLFLESHDDGPRYSVTGLRQGKFRIVERGSDDVPYVIPELDGVPLLEPESGSDPSPEGPTRADELDELDADDLTRAEPSPIHRQPTPLADVRERVRRLVGDDDHTPTVR